MVEGLLIAQAEYARRRGFSKQYVGQLVARGKITLVNGLVDPAAADAALAQGHDPARYATRPAMGVQSAPDPAAPGLQHSFAKARTVREHYRAMREKLEYEATLSELIPRADVELATFAVGRLLRDAVLAAAEPAAVELARRCAMLDPGMAEAVIRQHLDRALVEAADQIERQPDPCNLTPLAGTSAQGTP
jgi:hypothetical protein